MDGADGGVETRGSFKKIAGQIEGLCGLSRVRVLRQLAWLKINPQTFLMCLRSVFGVFIIPGRGKPLWVCLDSQRSCNRVLSLYTFTLDEYNFLHLSEDLDPAAPLRRMHTLDFFSAV